MFANSDELLKYIKDERVEMVDVRFCDLPGIMQHFTVPVSSFDQSVFDNGIGELSDAASALDWVQSIHPEAESTWIAGYSFGAWIGMQLLMRRPEARGFISIAPPANMYDFSFLAPCPSSGIIIQGEADEVVTPIAVQKLVDKLRTQRHITIEHKTVPGANHFFVNEMDLLMKQVDDYLDFRLDPNCPIR